MTEFRVAKNKIFSDERVILKSYSTIGYQYDDIPSEENSFRQPMSKELYSFYFLHTLEGMKHDRVKSAWLWNHFVRIYLPKLHQSNLNLSRFSLNKNTTDEDQRRLVSEYMKKNGNIGNYGKILCCLIRLNFVSSKNINNYLQLHFFLCN
jgi:hypothetical protein